jgi:hypothetical protein
MPYRPPDLGGLIHDRLVLESNGRVHIDGKVVGFAASVDLEQLRKSSPWGSTELYVRMEFMVVPQPHEPDAVFAFDGEKMGWSTPTGFVSVDDAHCPECHQSTLPGPDRELPGMWEQADLTGGETDT